MTARRAASVVVPTRDRPSALAECLKALQHQEDIDLEVIVVDDGSADRAGVRAVAETYQTTRVVRLTGRGPAAARNAGAAAATNQTVLFTDDDCIPQSGWAVTLEKAVTEGERNAVGGVALSAHGAPAVVVASELIFRYVQERLQLLGTGNLGCRRELVLALPFDEQFSLPAGEDREWCSRVVAAGGSLHHGDKPRAHHDDAPRAARPAGRRRASVRPIPTGPSTSAGWFLRWSHRCRLSSRARCRGPRTGGSGGDRGGLCARDCRRRAIAQVVTTPMI